jgi:hypothetical protein
VGTAAPPAASPGSIDAQATAASTLIPLRFGRADFVLSVLHVVRPGEGTDIAGLSLRASWNASIRPAPASMGLFRQISATRNGDATLSGGGKGIVMLDSVTGFGPRSFLIERLKPIV